MEKDKTSKTRKCSTAIIAVPAGKRNGPVRRPLMPNRKKVRTRGMVRRGRGVVVKIGVWAALLILSISIYVQYRDFVPAPQKEIRFLLSEVEQELDTPIPESNYESRAMWTSLEEFKDRLGKISALYKDEYEKATVLDRQIDSRIIEIRKMNKEMVINQ